MGTAISVARLNWLKEYYVGRAAFNPSDFGLELTRDEFMDRVAEAFNETFRGTLSLDELLLRPREATRFCDSIRGNYGWFDVPDDIILRSIMTRRKSPG